MSSNPAMGPFVIGERVGASVWLAEDTRNGRQVAVKLLTRQLPREQAKRDALLREVRVAAALYHTFLIPILEITPAGDNLLMVMEAVDAQPLARMPGTPLGRESFFRIAWQLASVVKYLHMKGVLHGNINGDSVLLTSEGEVKLAGLNLMNLHRRDRSAMAYQQKGSDPRSVAYMAPEQIASQTLDERSDVFSIGVLLYQLATGRLPFAGATPADVARAIVEGQPASPKSINPDIDSSVLTVLGRCLFKDPFKRQKDAKALIELIDQLDPQAQQFGAQFEKRVPAAEAASAEHRRSILFVAEVDDYDTLATQNPDAAAKAASRMQQILGESVYLFDGKVLDPFGTRLIAELPSVESALEAGRKGAFDLRPAQLGGDVLPVRMLLHAGELQVVDGMPAGPAIDKAFRTLEQVEPGTLFISEEFVREGRGSVRFRDAGARGGMKLFTIVEPELDASISGELTPTTIDTGDQVVTAAEEAVNAAASPVAPKRRSIFPIAAVLVLVLLAAIAAVLLRRERSAPASAPATAAAGVADGPTAEHPGSVVVARFTVDAPQQEVVDRATAVRLASIDVLRSFPELRVVSAATPDADSFAGHVMQVPAGPQLVASSNGRSSAPIAFSDAATGITGFVRWVLADLHLKRSFDVSPAVLNPFADAVVANAAHDMVRAETLVRAAVTADPRFLPAQLLAMDVFTESGKEADAVAAAKQVVALDRTNVEAAIKVARAAQAAGNLGEMIAHYSLVLERQKGNAEALNRLARYALSAGDAPRFNAILSRMKRMPPLQIDAFEPDLLTFNGRIDAAIQRYYTLEEQAPSSPALALRIGRLAVLRHSLPIAEIEQKKLENSDPLYGFHMLSAYIAAEKRQPVEARQQLDLALGASVPGDDAWTSAAEVNAILADPPGVLDALEKAAGRKEPTAAYILSNPLFSYLGNDPRFERVRASMEAQQAEVRTAFAAIR